MRSVRLGGARSRPRGGGVILQSYGSRLPAAITRREWLLSRDPRPERRRRAIERFRWAVAREPGSTVTDGLPRLIQNSRRSTALEPGYVEGMERSSRHRSTCPARDRVVRLRWSTGRQLHSHCTARSTRSERDDSRRRDASPIWSGAGRGRYRSLWTKCARSRRRIRPEPKPYRLHPFFRYSISCSSTA